MNLLTQERKYVLLFLFLGFLLSSLSSTLSFSYLHTPFAIQDFIYIPIFYNLYKKKYFKLKKINYAPLIVVWFFLTILGILMNPIAIGGILGVSRNFLWVILFYLFGKNIIVDSRLLNSLLVISLGSVICWCIDSYIGVNSINYDDSSGAINGNMMAIIYLFAVALFFPKKWWLICAILGLNVFLCVYSGLRRQISVSLLAFVLSYVLSTLKDRNTYKIAIGIGLVLIFSSVFVVLRSYIEEANPLLFYRVFTRSEMSMEGDLGESDTTRQENMDYIFNHFVDLFLPQGFPSSRTENGGGFFIDVPTYLLSYIMGVIPTILFIYYLIKLSVRNLFCYIKGSNPLIGMCAVICMIFLYLHFIDGSMYLFVYTVPLTGFTLGLLSRRDLEYSNKELLQ